MAREILTPSGGLFIELAPGAKSAALAPSFLLGGWRGSIARVYFSDIETPPVGCYVVPKGGVTSHGLVLCENRLVLSQHLNLNESNIAEARRHGPLLENQAPSRVIDGTAVSLVQPGHLVYGHWLVDILPKLFVLSRLGMDPQSLLYLLPINTPSFGFEWLRLLGLRNEQFVMYHPYEEIVAAERLIVPTLMRTSSCIHSLFGDAAQYLFNLVRSSGKLPDIGASIRRIHISRAAVGPNSRLMLNRAAIDQLVSEAGFTTVRPETIPLPEQIALFAEARQIVGEYGSGLHGCMFSPPGTFICAFRASTFHPGFLQSSICQVLDQKIGYVLGDEDEHAIIQEFSLDEEDVRLALRLLSVDLPAS